MGLFKKKSKVLDLTRYEKRFPQKKSQESDIKDLTLNSPSQEASTNSSNSNSGGFFGNFFGGSRSSADSALQISSESSSPDLEERRQKLVKRLRDMTDKLEELSNHIYKLQQRIELLERKANLGGSEF